MARKIKSRKTRRSKRSRSKRSRSKTRKYGGAANQNAVNENTPPFNVANYLENTETKMKDIAIQLIAKLYFNKETLTEQQKQKHSQLITTTAQRLVQRYETLKSNINAYLANSGLGGTASKIIHDLFDDKYELE